MPTNSSPDSITSLELALLRWLCVSATSHDSRNRVLSALLGHKWQAADHAIVCDALRKLPDRDNRPLREQLPAIATRLGFPDISWEDYFVVSEPASEAKVHAMLQKLLESGPTSE